MSTADFLIISCSATKVDTLGLLPAFVRYDGPAWRTLRAHAKGPGARLLALSAEHGLINGGELIADYDRLLDADRSAELLDLVAAQLEQLVGREPRSVFVFGSAIYRELVRAAAERAGVDLSRFTWTSGAIGVQLGQLKAYLTREDAR